MVDYTASAYNKLTKVNVLLYIFTFVYIVQGRKYHNSTQGILTHYHLIYDLFIGIEEFATNKYH